MSVTIPKLIIMLSKLIVSKPRNHYTEKYDGINGIPKTASKASVNFLS